MAQRVESRVASCAAGVLQANAIEVDLSFAPGTVTAIDLFVPSGHAGATGIAIAQAHQVIIPATGSDWIVGNDDHITWTVEDFLNTGNWSAFVYNGGYYEHSWYMLFSIMELVAPQRQAPPVPLAVGSIMAAGLT